MPYPLLGRRTGYDCVWTLLKRHQGGHTARNAGRIQLTTCGACASLGHKRQFAYHAPGEPALPRGKTSSATICHQNGTVLPEIYGIKGLPPSQRKGEPSVQPRQVPHRHTEHRDAHVRHSVYRLMRPSEYLSTERVGRRCRRTSNGKTKTYRR